MTADHLSTATRDGAAVLSAHSLSMLPFLIVLFLRLNEYTAS